MCKRGVTTLAWTFGWSMFAAAAIGLGPATVGANVADDESITTQVKSALASDPDLGKRQIIVNTFKKRVQLTGFVGSQKESSKAAELARSVDMVKSVQDNLMIEEGPGPHIIPPLSNWQSASP